MNETDDGQTHDAGQPVHECIRKLVAAEPFAVLCTEGGGQPYGSVVSFAMTDDLATAYFCTPVNTRKYHLLTVNPHVALVIDNRGSHGTDVRAAEAVTATGTAVRVADGGEFERGAAVLLARHPALREFVGAPSTALFRVSIVRYLHVWRFQEVRQWVPGQAG